MKKTFEEVLNEQGYLLYSNVGCSMNPLIREGKDLMVIESVKTRAPQLYDAVLFRRPNVKGRGEYVLHRILRINPDGTYWIMGDNCVSGEIVEPENVLGVLISVKRNIHNGGKKEIKIDDAVYSAYVKCWCRPYRARIAIQKSYHIPRRVASKIKHIIQGLD